MLFKCTDCNTKFKHKRSLIRHKKSNICKKSTENKFFCETCKKKYKTKRSLERHIKEKHLSEKSVISERIFVCSYCEMEFKNKYNLKRHVKSSCQIVKATQTNIINNIVNNNITNIDNSITNNIQINNFGKECLDDIDEKKLLRTLRSLDNIPLDYIKMKYIDTPQNRNIYLRDRDDQNMYIYNNGWKKEDKIKILNKIFVGAIDDINELNKNNFNGLREKRINDRLDKIEHENKLGNFQLGRVQNITLNRKNQQILNENFTKTRGLLCDDI